MTHESDSLAMAMMATNTGPAIDAARVRKWAADLMPWLAEHDAEVRAVERRTIANTAHMAWPGAGEHSEVFAWLEEWLEDSSRESYGPSDA